MKQQTMTMNELRKAGIKALTKELGPVNMARFIQQFDRGSGNYTEEREALLGDLTIEEIFEGAKKIQEEKKAQEKIKKSRAKNSVAKNKIKGKAKKSSAKHAAKSNQ